MLSAGLLLRLHHLAAIRSHAEKFPKLPLLSVSKAMGQSIGSEVGVGARFGVGTGVAVWVKSAASVEVGSSLQ